MSLIYYYPCGTYLVPTAEALKEIVISQVTIEHHGNGHLSVVYDTNPEMNIDNETEMYLNLDEFRSDNAMQPFQMSGTGIAQWLSPCCRYEQGEWESWTICGGIVKKVYFDDFKIKYSLDKPAVEHNLTLMELFESREDAIDRGTIKVEREDGTVEMVTGWKKKLELTDEQESIVRKIQSLFIKLQIAGGKIICISDEYKLAAVNGLHMEECESIDSNHLLADYGFELSTSSYGVRGHLILNYDEFDCINSDLNIIGKFKK